ncbi:hypothetical protein Kpol_1010p1 [Vanderwaltozyma polyspora DSM 70294]|uniref:Uncharacterized protein n=1 Tax=Vanderwaltozyma polyspora (strain ATCC 22028 / DSM 70294 / BCRC 21397 / CBS 2163 / NBRC 10782 / NRRL Y-8283 / UCD 57-17) TaxID=436907 RepID=A7TIF1_VANPO|nr:uncharacterized protein Kpol_1010p1 [Vanderwaltozyma polyspora DSM 70294]EDO17889.1 hypothetical protein Kpol_1010p1 [Vanderwaltozyma polyspora DSM 70294]
MYTNQDMLSTPPSKRKLELPIPRRPSKKIHLKSLEIVSSASAEASPIVNHKIILQNKDKTIKSNGISVISQRLNEEDTDEEDDIEDDNEIFSSTEAKISSPFSDDNMTPTLSSNDDLIKEIGESNMSTVNLSLDKQLKFHLTNLILKRQQSEEFKLLNHNKEFSSSYISKPQHRFQKPKKSILLLPKNSLNMIVSSSRGSLEDATIYATEINASLSKEGFSLPMVRSPDEKVTIPVNSEIKKRYKQLKKEYLNAFGKIDTESDAEEEEEKQEINKNDDDISNSQDAALIRGYYFENNSNSNYDNKKYKKVRWTCTIEDC